MDATILTILSTIISAIGAGLVAMWKFVQSRFSVQDILLQNCEKKHIIGEEKSDRAMERMIAMASEIGELKGQMTRFKARQDIRIDRESEADSKSKE